MINFKVKFILFAFLLGFISANEKCVVGDIDLAKGYYANDKIKETYNGIVAVFNTENVLDVSFEDSKYLTLDFGENMLMIAVKDLENFKKEQKDSTIKDKLIVKCEDKTYKIDFQQEIEFINNIELGFNKKEYKFVLYGQLKKGLELTKIFPIESLHNENMTNYPFYEFLDDTEGFLRVSTNTCREKYRCTANVRVDKPIFPPFEKEFTIVVKESYLESNSTSATIKIIVKQPDEKDLQLEESKYEGNVNEDTKEVIMSKPIKVVSGIDQNLVINLESEYASYFTTFLDFTRNQIKLKLNRDLPNTKSLNQIKIGMSVWNNGVKSNSNLLINLDKKIKEVCKLGDINLKQHSYRNPKSINDDHIGTFLKIDDTLNVKKITCSGSEYLECEFKNNIFTISTTEAFKKFEEKETEAKMEMQMVVECPDDKAEIKFIQNIQNINNHAPELDKKEYNYVFYDYLTKNLQLHKIMPIKATDRDLGWNCLNFKLSENDYFKINSNCNAPKESSAQLIAIQDIYTPKKIKLVLEVSDGGKPELNDTAVLNVEIKPNFDSNIVFTQQKYIFNYKNSTTFALRNPIQLENGFDEQTIFELKNSTFANNFKVKANLVRNCVEILPQGDLDIDEDYVILNLIARWKGHWNAVDVQVQFSDELPQIHSQLNGFIRWLFTSILSQMIVAFIALAAILTMLFGTKYYLFSRNDNTNKKRGIHSVT